MGCMYVVGQQGNLAGVDWLPREAALVLQLLKTKEVRSWFP